MAILLTKILVSVGDNNRIVAFTTPDPSIARDSAPVNDAAVLGSCHSGDFQGRHDERPIIIFTKLIMNQEWGGMYVDLVGTEQVANRSVCRAVLKPVVSVH